MNNKHLNSGFTLIEVIIAVAISAMMGAAAISLVLQAQSINTSAALKGKAVRYSEEILEAIRGFRDNCHWDELPSPSGTLYSSVDISGCSMTVIAGASEPCTSLKATSFATNFKRCILISDPSMANTIKVTSYVFYTDKGVDSQVGSSMYLSKY